VKEQHQMFDGWESRLTAYLSQQAGAPVTVSGLRPLSGGWETQILAFQAEYPEGRRDLVLRFYPSQAAAPRVRVEGEAMSVLDRLGYPVPALTAYETDGALFGGPFLVMNRVDGRPMWEFYRHQLFQGEMLTRFCALLVRLHRLDPVHFAGPGRLWESAGGATSSFSPAFLDRFLQLAGLQEPFAPLTAYLGREEKQVGRTAGSLIHGDWHPDNILLTAAGEPFVIDWSSAALDDPRVDLAQAALLSGAPERGEAIRAEYERQCGERLTHLPYYDALVLARRLGSIVISMVRGAGLLGMRPGLEQELRQKAGDVLGMLRRLEAMTGVPLPGVAAILEAMRAAGREGGL
jgi:aminoglycoside phosphotransferase (APT) family kinase protein